MWFLEFYFDFFFFIPEFLLIIYICVFTVYGLVYERSKYYSKLATALANVSSIFLTFIILLIIFSYWLTYFNSYEMDWLARSVLFEESYDVSKFALFNKVVCCLLSISCLQVSKTYFNNKNFYYFEVVILILIITLGGFIVSASMDFIIFYVGMEIISLSLYVFISLKKNEIQAIEASLKYFILGSIASACLVFGVAMLYSISGVTNVPMLSGIIFELEGPLKIRLYLGSLLILVGILYKLGAFPFHYWIGDVYLGSPTPVVLVMTTLAKYPMLIFLIKLNFYFFDQCGPIPYFIFFSGFFSIVVGSFYAYGQTHVKRLLAYSSVVHSGFMLLAMITGNFFAYIGIVTYSLIYFITSFCFFSFLLSCYKGSERKMFLHISDYVGLSEQQPLLSFFLTVVFFSYMSIPPLLGFFGKYFILVLLTSKIKVEYLLLIVLVTLIGSLYYFRFIRNIYFRKIEKRNPPFFGWEGNFFGYFLFFFYGIFLICGPFFLGHFIFFLDDIMILGFF